MVDTFPVTPHQSRILMIREWNQQHLKLGLPANVILAGIRLIGRLEIGRVQHALDGLMARHAALRTTFLPRPPFEGERMAALAYFARTDMIRFNLHSQRVHDDAVASMTMLDLRGLGQRETSSEIENALHDEENRPFDYDKPGLLRATMFRISEEEHLLVIVIDHIVSDGWSVGLLRRDFQTLYADPDGPLPPIRVQFQEFARWQEEAMAHDQFARHREFWRTQWAEFGEARIGFGDLPFTLAPTHKPTFKSGWECFPLTPDESGTIRRFCADSRVTLHMFFHAVFAAALHRVSGKPKVALWTQFANRPHANVQNTVGFFTNDHLVGVDMSDNPTLRELVRRTKSALLAAQAMETMPLDDLWQSIRCYPRYRDVVPYFDVRIPSKRSALIGSHLRVEQPENLPESCTERGAGLGVYLRATDAGLMLALQYSSDKFNPLGVRSLGETLHQLARGLVTDQDERVSRSGQTVVDYSGSTRAMEMSEFTVMRSDLIPPLQRPSR